MNPRPEMSFSRILTSFARSLLTGSLTSLSSGSSATAMVGPEYDPFMAFCATPLTFKSFKMTPTLRWSCESEKHEEMKVKLVDYRKRTGRTWNRTLDYSVTRQIGQHTVHKNGIDHLGDINCGTIEKLFKPSSPFSHHPVEGQKHVFSRYHTIRI